MPIERLQGEDCRCFFSAAYNLCLHAQGELTTSTNGKADNVQNVSKLLALDVLKVGCKTAKSNTLCTGEILHHLRSQNTALSGVSGI